MTPASGASSMGEFLAMCVMTACVDKNNEEDALVQADIWLSSQNSELRKAGELLVGWINKPMTHSSCVVTVQNEALYRF